MRILVVFLINLTLVGCGSLNRAESDRMLDVRAGYDSNSVSAEQVNLIPAGAPVRVPAKQIDVWMFDHPLTDKDYLLGAWVRCELEPASWKTPKPIELMERRTLGSKRLRRK